MKLSTLEAMMREVWTEEFRKGAELELSGTPEAFHVIVWRQQGDLVAYARSETIHLLDMKSVEIAQRMDLAISKALKSLPEYTTSDALMAGEARRGWYMERWHAPAYRSPEVVERRRKLKE